MTFKTRKRK